MSAIFVGLVGFVGVLGLVVIGYGIAIYNGLIFLKKQVDRAWANIDVLLKQRHDEIPQLVSVCEQYAAYERATLDRVMNARTKYAQATQLNEKVKAAGEMTMALRGVLAIGEAYPELRSSDQFVQIQRRISELESEIADRRELFNESVTNFNTRIEQIPDVFFARSLGYQQLELFKVASEERRMPSVRMKIPA